MGFVTEKQERTLSFLVKADELFVPVQDFLDVEKEKENILKELNYLRGFLESVNKKLANEKFVQNAKPEIIQNEQNKKADAEAKIKALEESLLALK